MKIYLYCLCLLATIPSIYAQRKFKIVGQFNIQSGGSWDYLIANPNSNQLYVSHGTQVNVLDKNTGDSIGVIENTLGVHGIALIPSIGKGYTSNGRTNNIFVFDLKTNKVLNQLPTGENPDAIFYEPISKSIVICNGRSKDLTIIDPFTEKVLATIPVGGKPETAVVDNNGFVYVNIEDKNEIVKVDLKNREIKSHIPLTPAEQPTGLAIDTKLHLLFAGCDEKLAIIDYEKGTLVKTIQIGKGCDGVAYNSNTKTLFTSNGSGSISVLKANRKNEFELIQTIDAPKGARTICIDNETKKVYLPTADFEAVVGNTRPKMIPGTMRVLVVE